MSAWMSVEGMATKRLEGNEEKEGFLLFFGGGGGSGGRGEV